MRGDRNFVSTINKLIVYVFVTHQKQNAVYWSPLPAFSFLVYLQRRRCRKAYCHHAWLH